MKKVHITFVLALFVAVASLQAQTFTLNQKNSQLNWTGKAAFSTYELTGTLESDKGSIVISDNKIESLEVTVDMKSLDHKNNRLKSHLRGKDFFEVKKFTKATFTLSEPVAIENGQAKLKGTLTIKNTSHQEDMEAIVSVNDGNVMLSFQTKIDRTKYGVKFNSPSFFKKMKENAIADLFVLKGDLHFH